MANNRRPPLSFPELEGRGRRAILRTPEEVQAEEALLDSQEANEPAVPSPIPDTVGEPLALLQQARMPASQNASKQASPHPGNGDRRIKATYRLSPEAIEAIEDAKHILRRKYNLKAGLEEIAEEAILAAYRDLLENQQASILAIQFASKTANKQARMLEIERKG